MPCPYTHHPRFPAWLVEEYFHPPNRPQTQLLENLPRKLPGGFAPFCDDVFTVESHFLELFRGRHIFCGRRVKLGQPFGIDVEAATALGERPPVKVLALLAEEPVDIDLRRIWMRRVFHHCDRAEAVTAAHTFFDRAQYFDRQAALDVGVDEALRQSQRDRESARGQSHRELLAVTVDE